MLTNVHVRVKLTDYLEKCVFALSVIPLTHTNSSISSSLSLTLYNTHTCMNTLFFSLSTFFLFYFFSTFCFVDPPGSLQQFLCTPLQNKKIRVGKVLSNRMCCFVVSLVMLWIYYYRSDKQFLKKKCFLTIAKRWFISKLSVRPLLIINLTKKLTIMTFFT